MNDIKEDQRWYLARPRIVRIVATALIILAGLLLAAPSNLYPARQSIEPNFSRIDESWAVSIPAALANGELAGRDFIFTYGPLYQVTHGLGLLVPPGNLASLLRFQYGVEVLCVMLGVWFVLGLTGAPLAWRGAVYLLWACFWPQYFHYAMSVPGLKPMAGLFWAAASGYLLAAPAETKPRLSLLKPILTWALATPVLILYAFDLGLLTFISLLFTAIIILLSLWSDADEHASATRRRTLACAAAATLTLLLFIGMFSRLKGWGNFLSDSWELAMGYGNTMSIPISGRRALILLAAAAGGAALLLLTACLHLRAFWRSQDLAGSRRSLALLAMACFCIIWLRSGLSRSDYFHVLWAALPVIFLAACFLPCYLRAGGFRLAWPLMATSVLFLSIPYVFFIRTALPPVHTWALSHLKAIRHLELKGAWLEVNHPIIDEASATARALPGDSLYVWPYETIVNAISGKKIVDYTLQSYAATTSRLEHASIARLEADRNLPVLIFTDSTSIDGVEALSRTSQIFRFLLEHYELAERHEKFVVLRRIVERNGQWQDQELLASAEGFMIGVDHSLRLDLPAEPASECRASDLLVLRLRLAKTRMLGFRKPGALFITLFLSNGEQRTQNLVVSPDGEPHEVIVSASNLREPAFLYIFTPNQPWRSNEHVTGLELRWSPLDWLSVAPGTIAVQRVSVIRRTGM